MLKVLNEKIINVAFFAHQNFQ
jgi:hypothetical protein